MPTITRAGKPPMTTFGDLPKVGEVAPSFTLTNSAMEDITQKFFEGKNIILSIFPSADTPTCALSIKRFNQEASKIPNTVILCVSEDLPQAHARFCRDEHIANVVSLSAFRNPEFGKQYGVLIMDGYLRGLFARGVIAINPKGRVIYSELVKELTNQPNYEAVLASLKTSPDLSDVEMDVEKKTKKEMSESASLADAFTAVSSKLSAIAPSALPSPTPTRAPKHSIPGYLGNFEWEDTTSDQDKGTENPKWWGSAPTPQGMTNRFDEYGNRRTIYDVEYEETYGRPRYS